MKGVTLPQSVIERVLARRGTEHCFATLEGGRTALVVVDMQNGFMDEAIGHAVCPAARDIVPAINRLAGAVRQSGGGVFWIKNTYDESCEREWSVMQEMATPEGRRRRAASMSEGSPGHDLWPAMDVRPDDEIVRKTRFSAFLPGASDLPARLRARGFDTVLITGTVTNICCESSARDAMMSNFRVVMVSDANAAMTPEEHDASLIALYLTFTDLMDTDMIVARLGQSAARRRLIHKGSKTMADITDDALALEFDMLAKRAGLVIPEGRRAGLFAGFKDLRGNLALLRQPRTAASEPAATFDITTVTRGLGA